MGTEPSFSEISPQFHARNTWPVFDAQPQYVGIEVLTANGLEVGWLNTTCISHLLEGRILKN